MFDAPYSSSRQNIGRVEVKGGTVYCYTEYNLTGKQPALEIVAVGERENGKTFVTSVKQAALFITDDDNNGAFYEMI